MPIKKRDNSFKAPKSELPEGTIKARKCIPFGQNGYIVETTPLKNNLDDRALKARYLRVTQGGHYLVLVTKTEKKGLIRMEEFLLTNQVQDSKQVDGTKKPTAEQGPGTGAPKSKQAAPTKKK